jgi:hypothetical protein
MLRRAVSNPACSNAASCSSAQLVGPIVPTILARRAALAASSRPDARSGLAPTRPPVALVSSNSLLISYPSPIYRESGGSGRTCPLRLGDDRVGTVWRRTRDGAERRFTPTKKPLMRSYRTSAVGAMGPQRDVGATPIASRHQRGCQPCTSATSHFSIPSARGRAEQGGGAWLSRQPRDPLPVATGWAGRMQYAPTTFRRWHSGPSRAQTGP